MPTDFEFILYKHGPFSFDLKDELSILRADELLDIKLNPYPYGPSLLVTDFGRSLIKRFPKTVGEYSDKIDYIAEKIGEKGVADLERLATALYVTSEKNLHNVDERAERIHELKPHVSLEEAGIAVQEIDAIIDESKKIVLY